MASASEEWIDGSGVAGGGAAFTVEEGLRHLLDAASDVLSTLDSDRLLEVLMDRAVALTRADRGFLMLSDRNGRLRFRIGRGFEQATLDETGTLISRSVAEEVFRTGQPILSVNAPDDAVLRNRRSVLELRLQTVMCAPLLAQGRALGVLYVDSNRVRSCFDKNGLAMFQAMASLAAIALENARLYALATTDQRTGLANSGLFQARLDEAIARARGEGRELALIIADIDHFKQVNDRHGHPAGDVVLAEAARRLRASLEPEDLIARIGGEEFAVLIEGGNAGTRSAAAGRVAERLRRAIAEAPIELAPGSTVTVTASFGVACFPAPAVDSGSELVDAADRALYEAKRSGRNRVVEASALAIAAPV